MRCSECGREATRIRLERCNACYMRRYRRGEVPDASVCAGCGERRRSALTRVALGVVCGNCSLALARTRPKIESMDELRRHVRRERRSGADRRAGLRGGRRVGDRPRAVPAFDPAVD